MSLLIEALKKDVALKTEQENDNASGGIKEGTWPDDRPWTGNWGQAWGDYPPVRPVEVKPAGKGNNE